MKRIALVAVAGLSLVSTACKQDHEFSSLVGADGVLRFNLRFSNETEVDLDIFVDTPGGETIYWDNKEDSSGGQLDVDCLCNSCDLGPSENIYWDYGGEAPHGTYTITVDYFNPCDWAVGVDPSSDYTLLVMQSGSVIEEYTGTLDSRDDSHEYTHIEGG